MRIIRLLAWLAVPAVILLCGVLEAGAQGVDARQACTPDAMRLCSQFIPDVAKVTSCMMSKRSQLSPECRVAMGGGSGGHAEHRHRTRVHCAKHSRHCS
jgi:hypothetical protein